MRYARVFWSTLIEMQEGNPNVDKFPVLFAQPLEIGGVVLEPLPIIVVGSVDENGRRSSFSQGDQELDVSAVGEAWCASGLDDGIGWFEGTSVATALVYGQVAIILAEPAFYLYDPLEIEGKVAKKMKDIIKESAYPRLDGEPSVLYNEVDYDCQSSANNDRRVMREVVNAAPMSCAKRSKTTITSTITSTSNSTSTATTISTTANTVVLTAPAVTITYVMLSSSYLCITYLSYGA
jgi:hypothetical protein